MCTVMTTSELWGRTMDFPPRTPWHLTYLPAGFQWQPAIGHRVITSRYRILGGMRHFAGHYLIGDGVNAVGLLCAELFFPVAAHYASQPKPGTMGLTPQDFITWVLGNHDSVAEVAAELDRITIVGASWHDGNHYPFHWWLQDQTGTYLIEPLGEHLRIRNNPVGVLTNTPAFDEQVDRLNSRLGLTSRQFVPTVVAAHHGSWPSGGNAVDRFQQATFQRWRATPRTVGEMQRFLLQVTVPHTPRHRNNYTHYRAVFDWVTNKYYFTDCHSELTTVKGLDDLTGPRPLTLT